ncbi:MAG TPA: response regulator [Gaiellaceae bacterium]
MDRQVGANAPPHLRGETSAGPAWRVLVADDEPPLRLLCRVALEYDGFIVLEAGDGIEALEVARLEKPDLILLDLMMPGLDGWRVATALSDDETTSRIPIVFLSAFAQPADRARGLESGAVGYITKPFDPLQLPVTVREFLGPADVRRARTRAQPGR